jgi:hypothetical protein
MIVRLPFRILVVALLSLAVSAAPRAAAQTAKCGAGDDLVVQALERITPQSGNDAFLDALELLKHAVSVCPELGDACTTAAWLRNASATTRSPNTPWAKRNSTVPKRSIRN